MNGYFIELRKQAEGPHRIDKEAPEPLLGLLEAFAGEAEKELASSSGGVEEAGRELLLQVYFAAVHFGRIGKLYDERYVTWAEMTREDVRIKLFCLDPSHLLREMGKGYRSRIYFSATLSPMSFYRDMLGAGPDDYTVSLPSPFSREQLEVAILPLSTRYHDRERTQGTLVRSLRKLTDGRPGNYLFFFPSYAYMNMIYEDFAAEAGESAELLLQQVKMSEEEREQFLAAFVPDRTGTFIAFAVMGGIFSEGIDLVGDRLTGVAIVGVGLPQIGLEIRLFQPRQKTGCSGELAGIGEGRFTYLILQPSPH